MKQRRKNDQIINSRERSPILPFVNCLRRIETENHLQVVNRQTVGLPEILRTPLCEITSTGEIEQSFRLN